ncbi:MAG TPA: helix-turn-helix domain-containing protein [Candidatus Fraserbacteria bacterium]|nr:helix-turn-helix domain-containing protein [Candidatus Fraserbacteria bacterium]
MKQAKEYLTTQDLAELFGRSPATIRYWLQRRHLNRYGKRFGRDWVFNIPDLLRFLDEEMTSWYADPQWASERRRLGQIKARLRRLNGQAGQPGKIAFRSYKLGSIQGSLRRVELYRDSHR